MLHVFLPREVLVRTLDAPVGVELPPPLAVGVEDVPGLDLEAAVGTRLGELLTAALVRSKVVLILPSSGRTKLTFRARLTLSQFKKRKIC